MTSDIPVFLDGRFVSVRMLEPSGQELVEETEFRDVGTCPVYPYPHPETITLPRHIPHLRRATNLGVVVPLSYFQLTMDMVRLGLCTEEPLRVAGHEVIPIEFAVAHILARRPRLLAEAGMVGPRGCLKVKVSGLKAGERHTYVFSISSGDMGAGEGTGIPAALGAILMRRGKIAGHGVFPPEAAVKPLDLLGLAGDAVKKLKTGADARVPIHLEHIKPDGTSSQTELRF
jgi:saccharopine dehydrogenase (NAD+, L-lysine-forming)